MYDLALLVSSTPFKAPIPMHCYHDIEVEEQKMNDFFKKANHPLLQPIKYIKYVCEGGVRQVAIAQPFRSKGSLRDLIHGVSMYNVQKVRFGPAVTIHAL